VHTQTSWYSGGEDSRYRTFPHRHPPVATESIDKIEAELTQTDVKTAPLRLVYFASLSPDSFDKKKLSSLISSFYPLTVSVSFFHQILCNGLITIEGYDIHTSMSHYFFS
jgi:hypothetical protein